MVIKFVKWHVCFYRDHAANICICDIGHYRKQAYDNGLCQMIAPRTVAYKDCLNTFIAGRIGLSTVQYRWLLKPHSDSHLGYLRKILLLPAISILPQAVSQTVGALSR